jgi:ferric-dicitrate binding protein FerR (iron transport regulator)
MHLNNENNYIEILIHSFLKNTITASEEKELFDWIKSDPANISYFNSIANIWLSASVFKDKHEINLEEAYQRVRTKNKEIDSNFSTSRFIKITWQKAAAVLIPVMLLSGLLTKVLFHSTIPQTLTVFEVPYGSKSTVVLPDGSKVILNAGSKLTYNNEFGYKHRSLRLLGEGYFKVAKNKDMPFIVHAGNITIKATGTEFDVKAYSEDKTIETILVEGSVEVNKIKKVKSAAPFVLMPSQSLIYNKESDHITINVAIKNKDPKKEEKLITTSPLLNVSVNKTEIDPVINTTWKETKWNINKKDLSELTKELERKYDVTIQLDSEKLKSIKFTGTLKDESLEQVLAAISIAFPIEYKIVGKNVEITENKEQMKFYDQYYYNNSN